MKFAITVELLQGDKPVKPQDLKVFGTINFLKGAPKAFKRALKATCWPFDANVMVHLIDETSIKLVHNKGAKNEKRISKGRGKKRRT